MAGFLVTVKIIIIPALIAAFIYVSLAFVVVPLIRRHRERYSQYVPVDSILETTSAVRSRLTTKLLDLLIRAFSKRRRSVDVADQNDDDDDVAFGNEEGETMVGFDMSNRARTTVRGGNVAGHSDARLSRDLEEGFRDDSEEDLVDNRTRQAQRAG